MQIQLITRPREERTVRLRGESGGDFPELAPKELVLPADLRALLLVLDHRGPRELHDLLHGGHESLAQEGAGKQRLTAHVETATVPSHQNHTDIFNAASLLLMYFFFYTATTEETVTV